MINRYGVWAFGNGCIDEEIEVDGRYCKYTEVVEMLEAIANDAIAMGEHFIGEHILDELELMRLRGLK